MVPAAANFAIYQGADFSDCIYLKNTDGTPFEFTYTHARLQLREDYGQPPIISLDETDGITLTAAEGKIQIDVDADVTEPFELYGEPGMYLYDIVCYDDEANPQVDRVAQGYFVIWPEVSRVNP